MTAPVLRPYQERVIAASAAQFRAGRRSVLICSPTGSGKSTIGAAIAARHIAKVPGASVLWLAHRSELVEQAAATLERTGLRVGVIAASASRALDPTAPVQVASPQTLIARNVDLAPTLVIPDEAHHYPADQWGQLIARIPKTVIVGLSATPARENGAGLSPMFDALVTAATIRELTHLGFLAPLDVIAPGKALKPGQISMRPVDAWQKYAEGRQAVVFAPHLKAARAFLADFAEAGVGAAIVSGDLDPLTRAQRLHDYDTGLFRVLINVGVLTEGWDHPPTGIAILARRCGSVVLFLQIAGRILRPHAAKKRALFLDLTGAVHLHGAPDADRLFNLEGRAITRGVDIPAGSFCKVCGALLSGEPACVECGTERDTTEAPAVTNTPMKLLAKDFCAKDSDVVRIGRLRKWLIDAESRGIRQGAAMHKFKGVYERYPTSDEIRAALGKAS